MVEDTELRGDNPSGKQRSIELRPGDKRLFFNDTIVAERENVQRVVHQPDKQGTVIEPDEFWEGGRVAAFSAPFWVSEENLYKMIYRPNYKDWSGLVVSEDGIEWRKPTLGLVEFDGSTQNNIVSDDRIRKVVRDPSPDDPDHRFKAFAGKTPVASPDLVHWHELDAPDITGGDSGSLTYDEATEQFFATIKEPSDEEFRKFSLHTSDSFTEWDSTGVVFEADKRDQRIAKERIRQWLSDPGRPRPLFTEPSPAENWESRAQLENLPKRRESWNAQVQNVSVFPYHGQYIAFITLLYPTGAYRPDPINTSGFFMVEVAMSPNLEDWTRVREPFLEPSRLDAGVVGNYDRMLVQPVNRPVRRGEELWVYYFGGKEHQGFESSQWTPGRYETYMDGTERSPDSYSDLERADMAAGQDAVHLATLRLDGFVSMSATDRTGTIVTEPLDVGGESLYLNCDASEGYARVQVLDREGNHLSVPGSAASQTLNTDAVKTEVYPALMTEIANGSLTEPIRLRVQLNEADLYAIWSE